MAFQGKSVIVTGAGSGIGEATALAYGRQGAKVLVADIDAEAAVRTSDAIRGSGGTAEAHRVDLRRRDEVFAMVAAAVDRFGAIDILSNVAGIYPGAAVEQMTEALFDHVIGVNLKGPLFACQAALPLMNERGGAIVNVASGAAFYAIRGLSAYAAAKGGLVSLTRVVALEAGPKVRVNTVIPGPTATGGVRAGEGRRTADAARTAPSIQRWLDPAEIADVILWVSSDAASAVNGAFLRVDGGNHML
jgi:NAD(P)-dependent dehydrogenase (short-subunit alcohol dehydrogenase family)